MRAGTGGLNLASFPASPSNSHHSSSCETTITNARPMPKLVMARVFASVASRATVGLLSGSVGSFTGASMRDGLRQVRIAHRQQGPLFELEQKHGQPQSADPQGGEKIHPVDAENAPIVWRDQPEQIYKTHDDNESGDAYERAGPAFQAAREQNHKGQREMEDNEQKPDPLPSAPEALHVPRNLVHQIAGPDNQELREREVGPQHREGEEQLADVVQMRRTDDAGQGTSLIGKDHQQGNAERERREPLTGEKQQ